ncbi:MAG: response regulator transcription factor [Spirochaetes bacterium]|nr:response regulator transcription factor [Spirochaetota bacterium]
MYKIVIVDDNWETCELFKVMLENLEIFKVVAFESGESFLEFIKDGENFDVAIIDLDLPDVHGFDLIKNLRENFSITLPIIVITGFGDSNHKFKALSLGADDYIVKPINMFEVVLKISNFVKKKIFIEEILNREEIIREKATMLNMFVEFIKNQLYQPMEEFLIKIKEIKDNKNLEKKFEESFNFLNQLDNKLIETMKKIEGVLNIYNDKKNEIETRKKKLQSLAEIEEVIDLNIKNNIFRKN